MIKKSKKNFSLLQRAEFLVTLINSQNSEEFISKLNASELQSLRDFLEDEVLFMAPHHGLQLTKEQIKSSYPSVHDYYYSYDCRESLDSCYNEACLASNPNCFSRKMREQIKTTLDWLNQRLRKEKEKEKILELERP